MKQRTEQERNARRRRYHRLASMALLSPMDQDAVLDDAERFGLNAAQIAGLARDTRKRRAKEKITRAGFALQSLCLGLIEGLRWEHNTELDPHRRTALFMATSALDSALEDSRGKKWDDGEEEPTVDLWLYLSRFREWEVVSQYRKRDNTRRAVASTAVELAFCDARVAVFEKVADRIERRLPDLLALRKEGEQEVRNCEEADRRRRQARSLAR